jgi:hypothetical protein
VFAYALPKLLSDVHDVTGRLAHALSAGHTWMRESTCAIGGHDYLLHLSNDGICLRCADCGHETPGWHIEPRIGRRRA